MYGTKVPEPIDMFSIMSAFSHTTLSGDFTSVNVLVCLVILHNTTFEL